MDQSLVLDILFRKSGVPVSFLTPCTFNYTNALIKEMLNQKLITGKDYRSILKTYFHV
jgi:hypothetical protein